MSYILEMNGEKASRLADQQTSSTIGKGQTSLSTTTENKQREEPTPIHDATPLTIVTRASRPFSP